MIITLQGFSDTQLLSMKEWIMELSPDSKLLIGCFDDSNNIEGALVMAVDLKNDWAPMKWEVINKAKSTIPQGFFVWGVELSEEDAVHFKLAWG